MRLIRSTETELLPWVWCLMPVRQEDVREKSPPAVFLVYRRKNSLAVAWTYMLVGNSHLHLETGEMQRLSSFLSPSAMHRFGTVSAVSGFFRLVRKRFPIYSTCPKTLAVICCTGDKTLKGIFDENDLFPHTLILAACCPLLVAVTIFSFPSSFSRFFSLAVPFLPFFPRRVAGGMQHHTEYLCCGQQAVKFAEVKQPCRGSKLDEEPSTVLRCSEVQRARSLLSTLN